MKKIYSVPVAEMTELLSADCITTSAAVGIGEQKDQLASYLDLWG